MAHVHPTFPPAPVPHQPSPLSFGFGCPRGMPSPPPQQQQQQHAGSTSFGTPLRRPAYGQSFSSPAFPVGQHTPPAAAVGFGFGSPQAVTAVAGPSSPAAAAAAARPSASRQHSAAASPASRRRARDDLSDDSDEDDGAQRAAERHSVRPLRGMKKSKVDPFGRGEGQGAGAAPANGQSTINGTSNDEPDLGVLLALLPPTSLLPILTSLVQRHPTLKPDLLSLLPQPSLSVALEALRAAESKVRSAVPFGWDVNRPGGGVSEHYVVGRIQESVGELVALVQSHLPIFLPSASAPSPSSRPPPHPTDQFSYLQHSTALLIRLAGSLPSLPAFGVLWARLAREWVGWADTVSRWVNREGGMIGAGVADGWVRELDLLVGEGAKAGRERGDEGKIRGEMALVREKWVRECGWLVGRRLANPQADFGMMEEEL